jgi:hypothetical protein
MKAKVKPIKVEVEKAPEKFPVAGSFQLIGKKFPVDGNFSEQEFEAELVRQIRADHEACERSTKLVAVSSLRNGIRLAWVRDHSPKKSALPFIAEHFPLWGKSTAYNYLRVADQFLLDAGLKDKRTFMLTDASKIEPILSTQLELFDSSEMKLEGAMKKLIKWIGDRGITQIYRDLSSEAPEQKLTGGARTKTKKTARDLHKEALEALHDLLGLRQGDWWQHLDQGEMATLITNLHDWQKEANAFTKGPKTPAIRKASDADV